MKRDAINQMYNRLTGARHGEGVGEKGGAAVAAASGGGGGRREGRRVEGLTVEEFGEFTKTFCRLPGFFQTILFTRVAALYKGASKERGKATATATAASAAAPAEGGKVRDGTSPASRSRTRVATSSVELDASPPSTQMAGAAIDGDDTVPSPSASSSTSSPPLAAAAEVLPLSLSLDTLLRFWEKEMAPYDATDRLFRLLKQPGASYIVKEDLFPFLRRLLETHPGLEFLRTHPDFQQKYALTVAARIFYTLNRAGTGKISAKELRRSGLLAAMRFVDENEDINKETAFFSYEHFYVLYCRFWELDTDRDGFLSREDLLKYGDHSLSNAIVDRIFEVGTRPFEDGLGGKRVVREREKMLYEDFIFFMLSEEDKGNEASLRYWFHCVDVDGDGRLSFQDMRYFYNIQLQRMEWLGHELVPFEDVLCQMLDMLKPTRDLSRCRQHPHLAAVAAASAPAGAVEPVCPVGATAAGGNTLPPVAAAAAAAGGGRRPSPMEASPSLVAAAAAAFAQEEEVRVGGLHIEDFLLPDKIKIAGVFFDALFNLNKFLAFEQRDPFGDRQKREDPFECDWERFAYKDYQSLAMETEDEEEIGGGSGGGEEVFSEEVEDRQLVTRMEVEGEDEEGGEEEDDDDDDDDGTVVTISADAMAAAEGIVGPEGEGKGGSRTIEIDAAPATAKSFLRDSNGSVKGLGNGDVTMEEGADETNTGF